MRAHTRMHTRTRMHAHPHTHIQLYNKYGHLIRFHVLTNGLIVGRNELVQGKQTCNDVVVPSIHYKYVLPVQLKASTHWQKKYGTVYDVPTFPCWYSCS